MKHYTIEKLPDEPILYAHVQPGFTLTELVEVWIPEFKVLLEEAAEPFYYIVYFEAWNMNIPDTIKAANFGAGQESIMGVFHHPNLIEFITVTEIGLVALAAKGMGSAIFGNLPVSVFKTKDEALVHVRGEIAAG